jgi:hypothetical protein
MAEKPTSIILRFRDLVTPLGDTIRRHQEEVARGSHVCWGWWSKTGEVVPTNIFGELLAAARELDSFSELRRIIATGERERPVAALEEAGATERRS